MAGFTSFATTAVQALGAVNNVVGAVDSFNKNSGKEELKQTKARQNLDLQNKQEDAALQKEQIRLSAEQTENERRAALRRAVAKQRASAGASGTGSSDGSGRAILLGLFDESDEERAQRESLDTLKSKAIDTNINQQKRINTLQLSQLKEKNNLSRFTSAFDSASSVL